MAHWFLPIVGVVYSAGFLVVFTYSKNFGFDGTELFQGKYIHVGSLFLMAAIVIGMPTYWLLQLCAAGGTRGKPSWSPTMPGVIIYSTMLFTIYLVVAFTDRGFFHRNPVLVLSNFIVPVAYSLLRVLLILAFRDRVQTNLTAVIGIVAAGIQLHRAHATLAAEYVWERIANIFPLSPPSGVYGFIALTILNILFLSLAAGRWRATSEADARLRIMFSTAALVGVLFYSSVLAFAYSVYPFIPSAKGGGSYIDSIPVEISFDPKYAKMLPDGLRNAITKKTSQFVIIYRNSDSIFVASKQEGGTPWRWQEPGLSKPRVYELRRDMITGITYLNQ